MSNSIGQRGGIIIIVSLFVLGVGLLIGVYLVAQNTSWFSQASNPEVSVIPNPSPTSTPAPVPAKTPEPSVEEVYENPFSEEVYQNPFEEEYENPFNNL